MFQVQTDAFLDELAEGNTPVQQAALAEKLGLRRSTLRFVDIKRMGVQVGLLDLNTAQVNEVAQVFSDAGAPITALGFVEMAGRFGLKPDLRHEIDPDKFESL